MISYDIAFLMNRLLVLFVNMLVLILILFSMDFVHYKSKYFLNIVILCFVMNELGTLNIWHNRHQYLLPCWYLCYLLQEHHAFWLMAIPKKETNHTSEGYW